MYRATSTTRSLFHYSQANPSNLKAAFFHSTPVLERKRRLHRNFRQQYPKRSSKERLFDFDVFSAHLFQSWHNGFDAHGPSSSQENSWFRREHGAKRSRGSFSGQSGANSSGRRAFHFCEDDDDVETIFRSSFGGNRFFYWSFVDEDGPRQRSSSNQSNKYKTRWRRMDEEDYDSSESDGSEIDLDSDRLTLGLSSSGPLNMEDVKKAYHACAMKWHPDRHQGSSKADAEEKFKACSAAYESLCGKLV